MSRSPATEDAEDSFRACYEKFAEYPRSLARLPCRAKLIQACSRFIEAHENRLFPKTQGDTEFEVIDYGGKSAGLAISLCPLPALPTWQGI